jgi:hypothetical protein
MAETTPLPGVIDRHVHLGLVLVAWLAAARRTSAVHRTSEESS